MSKIVALAKEQLEKIIYNAAGKAIAEGVFPETELGAFKIETPSNREHGDYAVNAAMVWSKAFRNAPRKIAEELTARFDFNNSYVKSCEIAGPGFINFFLSDKYYSDIVADVGGKDRLCASSCKRHIAFLLLNFEFIVFPFKKYPP